MVGVSERSGRQAEWGSAGGRSDANAGGEEGGDAGVVAEERGSTDGRRRREEHRRAKCMRTKMAGIGYRP